MNGKKINGLKHMLKMKKDSIRTDSTLEGQFLLLQQIQLSFPHHYYQKKAIPQDGWEMGPASNLVVSHKFHPYQNGFDFFFGYNSLLFIRLTKYFPVHLYKNENTRRVYLNKMILYPQIQN